MQVLTVYRSHSTKRLNYSRKNKELARYFVGLRIDWYLTEERMDHIPARPLREKVLKNSQGTLRTNGLTIAVQEEKQNEPCESLSF